ncbi:MAG: hypothetical protein PHG08_06690 [Bacilli bacterium]|nr:hypothetical protein [Bacilli bacterium]HHU24879.1 hypothetical protein [Acholeplasmataceae bacterium]
MKLKRYKIQTEAIIFILMGVLMLVIPKDFFKSIISIFVGVSLIFINLPGAIYGSKIDNEGFDLTVAKSFFLIFLGIGVLIWGVDILSTIWGIIILIPLLIDTLTSSHKWASFRNNIGQFFFALFLIILGLDSFISILIGVAGIILILYGIVVIVLNYKLNPLNFKFSKKDQNSKDTKKKNIVDVNYEVHDKDE